jgi:hypothetical protein
METQLELGLVPVIRVLVHESGLQFKTVAQAVANGRIKPIAVKQLHGPAVTDVSLTVNEYLVVERRVPGSFAQVVAVKGNIHEDGVAKSCPEVLVVDPSLLVPKTVPKENATTDFLRQQAAVQGVSAWAEISRKRAGEYSITAGRLYWS